MASPDAIILLIVDYHAAIGGQDPSAPLAYAPVSLLEQILELRMMEVVVTTGAI